MQASILLKIELDPEFKKGQIEICPFLVLKDVDDEVTGCLDRDVRRTQQLVTHSIRSRGGRRTRKNSGTLRIGRCSGRRHQLTDDEGRGDNTTQST